MSGLHAFARGAVWGFAFTAFQSAFLAVALSSTTLGCFAAFWLSLGFTLDLLTRKFRPSLPTTQETGE